MLLVAVIFAVGTSLGVLTGYFGGKVDTVIMRISDMMISFPGMILAIAIAGILGGSLINAIIALTIVTWTKYARLARSMVLKIKNVILSKRQLSTAVNRHIFCGNISCLIFYR